jgi:hypothetical protein
MLYQFVLKLQWVYHQTENCRTVSVVVAMWQQRCPRLSTNLVIKKLSVQQKCDQKVKFCLHFKQSSNHADILCLVGGFHGFLSVALYGGQSSSHLNHFTSRKTTSSTHWIGGCMCPRAGLDSVLQVIQVSAPVWHRTQIAQPFSPLPRLS